MALTLIANLDPGLQCRNTLNAVIDLVGANHPWTSGSIPYTDAGADYAQDNANFFWDATSKLLTSGNGLKIKGTTSGVVTLNTRAIAGTWALTLPDTAGTNTYVLTTDGFGITSWTAPGGGGGMAIGGTITSAISGSVLFAGAAGVLAQDNASFFFNDATNDLKIGGKYLIGTERAVYYVPHASGNNWFEGAAGNTSVTGYANFGTGDFCLNGVSTGFRNTAIGYNALGNLSSGAQNVAIGYNAGSGILTGTSNFAVGAGGLQQCNSGSGNVAIGTNNLINIIASGDNMAIGNGVFNAATDPSNYNVGIGVGANIGTGGSANVIIGGFAGYNLTSASRSTLIGAWEGPSPGVGVSNVIALTDGQGITGVPYITGVDYNYTNSGIWSFQRAASPIGLHVYNTTNGSPAVNYERGVFDWNVASNILLIGAQAGGTGTLRLTAVTGFAKAGAPAAGDLPANAFAVVDDTSAGQTWLVFNKAGTIRKVQLT